MKLIGIFVATLLMSLSTFAAVPKLYKKAVKNGGEYKVVQDSFLRFSTLKEKGAPRTWEFVERKQGREVVFVVGVTPKNEIVLGQQWRIPVQSQVLDLPGGLVADKNSKETVLQAAKRELMEETGYNVDIKNMKLVNSSPSSAGLTNEVVHLVVAQVPVTKAGAPKYEKSEKYAKYTPVLVSLDKAEKTFAKKRKQGVLVDHKIYSALYYLKNTKMTKKH